MKEPNGGTPARGCCAEENVPICVHYSGLAACPANKKSPHWHDEIELVAVSDGELDFFVNGELHRLTKGKGIFVNSGHVHYSLSEDPDKCKYILMHINPFTVCHTAELVENYILPTIESAGARILFDSVTNGGTLFALVSELAQFAGTDEFAIRAAGSALYILAELYAHTKSTPRVRVVGASVLCALRRMLSFVHEHYNKKVTLEDIARAGSMCPSSCTRVFKRYLHRTPVNYLIEYRLKKAKELVTDSEMKIRDICLETGFRGVSYFIEMFRKSYGVSPLSLRKSPTTGV